MTHTIPSLKKEPQIDRASIKSNLKYLKFGIRLWTLRERQKIRSKEMAQNLGISFKEYRQFEAGETLPDQNTLAKIAELLNVNISNLVKYTDKDIQTFAGRTISKGAKKYLYYWDIAEQEFKKNWVEHHSDKKNISPTIKNILKDIKKESCLIRTLPLLPLELYLVLDTLLDKQYKSTRALKDIQNFVVENENLASYIARDPFLGPFIFVTANKLYFAKKPYDSIEECLNKLSMQQFSDLLYYATALDGIHVQYQDLPALQQFIEFSSLGVLMVRELRKFLPDEVDYNHLYMAALTQGLGTYAFYTTLLPYIESDQFLGELKPNEQNRHEKNTLLHKLNWEFHSIISAMIAANWDLPKEVIQVLIDHHKQPTESVSAVCAALKLVNFFVDCDFPRMQAEEIKDLLLKYPQLKIKTDSLLKVADKMNKMSEYLIEMNSTVLDNKQASTKKTDNVPSEVINLAADSMGTDPVWTHNPPLKNEFRFDAEYSKVLTIDCSKRYDLFLKDKLFPKKGESLLAYGERIQNLQLGHQYAISRDLKDLSARFQLSAEEIAMRLKL